jgi:hypothetical protein
MKHRAVKQLAKGHTAGEGLRFKICTHFTLGVKTRGSQNPKLQTQKKKVAWGLSLAHKHKSLDSIPSTTGKKKSGLAFLLLTWQGEDCPNFLPVLPLASTSADLGLCPPTHSSQQRVSDPCHGAEGREPKAWCSSSPARPVRWVHIHESFLRGRNQDSQPRLPPRVADSDLG